MQYGAWDHWKKKVVKDSMWGKRIQKMNCGRENYQHERRVASNKGTSDVDNLWWYLPSQPWIQWWNHWLQSQCVCLNFGKHEWLKKKKSVKVFLVEKGFWTYPRRVTPQPLWKICVNVQSTWPKSPFFTVKSISWCSDGTSCITVRVHCLWSSQWASPKAVLPFHLVVNLTYLRLSWRATSPAHTSKTLPPKGSTNICVTEDLGVLLMLTEVDLLVKAVIYKPWKRRR